MSNIMYNVMYKYLILQFMNDDDDNILCIIQSQIVKHIEYVFVKRGNYEKIKQEVGQENLQNKNGFYLTI